MMRAVKSQIIQTKTVLTVPKGGEAEPKARVTFSEGRPKGIVHFIGGAVVGAAPQLSYKFFINRIASNGYTVIQTPYPFTFSHESLANDLFQSYLSCLKNMRESGLEEAVPENVPTHGIGHSNGSLMHLLIGSFFQAPYDSNVLLSYNNKEVDEAIPIPGFVSTMRPLLQQGRERGIYMSKEDIRQRCLDVLQKGPMPMGALGFSGDDLGPLLSQLSSCLEEIESGVTNFSPTPAESRVLIASRYTIPQLLMIKFADDGIDETPAMLRLLRAEQVANRALIQDIILPGNHTTPCLGPDETSVQSNLTVGSLVGAAASLWNYNDLTKTCETVTDWLDRY